MPAAGLDGAGPASAVELLKLRRLRRTQLGSLPGDAAVAAPQLLARLANASSAGDSSGDAGPRSAVTVLGDLPNSVAPVLAGGGTARRARLQTIGSRIAPRTSAHPKGAITDEEMEQGISNVADMRDGRVARELDDGTPLQLIYSNKKFSVYAAEDAAGLVITMTEASLPYPAEIFFRTLTEVEYQLTYDDYIKHKSVVGHVAGNEVLFHEVKFPTPMTNRDYVYYRKIRADKTAEKEEYCWMQRDVPDWGREWAPEAKGVIRAGRGDFRCGEKFFAPAVAASVLRRLRSPLHFWPLRAY